jgi:hypothetical protein
MTSNSESLAADAPDIVALSASVGLTPSEWLALITPAAIEPPILDQLRDGAMSTVQGDFS